MDSNSPIQVGKHVIPAGHMLMPSLTTIMRGDQDWAEPEKFNPDRFIENDSVKKSEAFIPFGAGKRKCPGESLARAEIFLFLVGLLQKFHFEGTEPGKKVEMFIYEGHLRHPNPKSPIKVTKIGSSAKSPEVQSEDLIVPRRCDRPRQALAPSDDNENFK